MKMNLYSGHSRFLWICCALVGVAAIGCGDDTDPPMDGGQILDAGSDARRADAGPDAGRDAGSDLGACEGCLIGAQCFAEGMVNADQPCEICTMATSMTAWSPNDGAACDDGLFCTESDVCAGSTCGGTARDCSDGIACNGEEVCNNDTSMCDMGETACGPAEMCDEAVDMCICNGCVVDGACYADGAANPDESCQVCDMAVSAVDWSALADGAMCDDGLFCTGTNLCGGGTCSVSAGDPCASLGTICDESTAACVMALHSQTFDFSGATESYVVRAGATQARITVVGAAGGSGGSVPLSEPGLGASMQGIFSVTPGQELTVMVGEQGHTGRFVAGGGGGSFVWDSADMLLIAAGGGGGGGFTDLAETTINGIDASTSTSGTAGASGMTGGGVDGMGGSVPTDLMTYASGGAGWLSDGANGTTHGCDQDSTGGQTPLAGGAGGSGGGTGETGGYGGGGGGNARCGAVGGGGGGGYSGGAGGGEMIPGEYAGGGGGGSFNLGTTQSNTAGEGMANGQVIIEVF